MTTAPTRVLEQGRCTIPADVRKKLDLKKGDYIVIDVRPLADGGKDD